MLFRFFHRDEWNRPRSRTTAVGADAAASVLVTPPLPPPSLARGSDHSGRPSIECAIFVAPLVQMLSFPLPREQSAIA